LEYYNQDKKIKKENNREHAEENTDIFLVCDFKKEIIEEKKN